MYRTAATLLGGCFLAGMASSCIDEDLSKCGADYALKYRVELHTVLDDELNRELTTPAERALADKLRTALSGFFSDHAQDLSLQFYTPDRNLSHYEQHVINSNEAGYTFYLPVDDYRHLALANTEVERVVDVAGRKSRQTLALSQQKADTIPFHSNALFLGREDISLSSGKSEFIVPLYMQNSAVSLVLDPGDNTVEAYRCYVSGMADGFRCNDSLYTYEADPVIRTGRIDAAGLTGFYAGCFPSPSELPQRGASTDSDVSDAAEDAYWQLHLYVTIGGKTTYNRMYVKSPLYAGTLRIIKARIKENGEVVVDAREVGVSITLDWKPGGDHDVEI